MLVRRGLTLYVDSKTLNARLTQQKKRMNPHFSPNFSPHFCHLRLPPGQVIVQRSKAAAQEVLLETHRRWVMETRGSEDFPSRGHDHQSIRD